MKTAFTVLLLFVPSLLLAQRQCTTYYRNGGYVTTYYDAQGRATGSSGAMPKGQGEIPDPPRPNDYVDEQVVADDESTTVPANRPPWQYPLSIRTVGLKPFPKTNDFLGCGPYVLATTLSSYLSGFGDAAYERMLLDIDPGHDGTPTSTVVDCLNSHGFLATNHEPATARQLMRQLARGMPSIITVRAGKDQQTPHSALVIGCQTDRDGNPVKWTLLDNGWVRGDYTHDEFMSLWIAPRTINSRQLPSSQSIPPRHMKHTSNSLISRRSPLSCPTVSLYPLPTTPRIYSPRYLRHPVTRCTSRRLIPSCKVSTPIMMGPLLTRWSTISSDTSTWS